MHCFQNHVNCSETFYKNSILNDVRDREDVDPAEKTKMLEMLKRIQELGEDDLDGSDGDSEEDTALAALAGLDLGKSNVQALCDTELMTKLDELLRQHVPRRDTETSDP